MKQGIAAVPLKVINIRVHLINICGALRDLAPFAQFKKREKHPWRSVTFPETLLKLTLLHECFSRFLNCTNGTKTRKASHMFKSI